MRISCILVREILDTSKAGSIRRPKVLLIFFFNTLFLLIIEETLISWVGWVGFEFCVVLEGQFFASEL